MTNIEPALCWVLEGIQLSTVWSWLLRDLTLLKEANTCPGNAHARRTDTEDTVETQTKDNVRMGEERETEPVVLAKA